MVSLLTCAGVTSSAQATNYPPIHNPDFNVTPVFNFDDGGAPGNRCLGAKTTPTACALYRQNIITHAHAREGVKALRLPSNWLALTAVQQMFVIINFERIDRGYPAFIGPNSVLKADAVKSLKTQTISTNLPDFKVATIRNAPAIGQNYGFGSNVLGVDYVFFYDDGIGGWEQNGNQCPRASSTKCWATRDGLLGYDAATHSGSGVGCTKCQMGIADAPLVNPRVFFIIDAQSAGPPPATTFTWAEERKYLS